MNAWHSDRQTVDENSVIHPTALRTGLRLFFGDAFLRASLTKPSIHYAMRKTLHIGR
tara:strand:- start:845 stop:1015 length:171 start_codon:yes stop_codon:yes gene_type:complete